MTTKYYVNKGANIFWGGGSAQVTLGLYILTIVTFWVLVPGALILNAWLAHKEFSRTYTLAERQTSQKVIGLADSLDTDNHYRLP